MRTLMVSDVYFPRVNGVSTSIETFRHALAAEDVQVTLVAPRYGNEEEEARIHRVNGRPVPGDPEDRLVNWKTMHQTVLDAAQHCDVIHIQTPFVAHYAGLAAAKRLNKPVIATYHTLFEAYLEHYLPLVPAPLLRQMARYFSRHQCNALNGIIVPSVAMRNRLLEYGVTTPLHILPTGIPLGNFDHGQGQRFREEWQIPPNRPIALFVGRVAHEKNIGFLLDMMQHALQLRPDLCLAIAGEGPALGDLVAQTRSLGLSGNVRFIGYLDRAQSLPDCYAAADVFVFASKTETQGLVLLEAMAAGLPVVALAEMGTKDILEPGKGCLTPSDNPSEFAHAVCTLLNDPEQHAHKAAEAQAFASTWSDTACAHRLARFYRELLWEKWEGQTALAVNV